MSAADAGPATHCAPEAPGRCVTCGDVAVAVEVVELDEARGLALCQADDGQRETVEIALVLPVAVGERVMVHAGAAIARLDGGA